MSTVSGEQMMEFVSIQDSLQRILKRRIWGSPIRQKVLEMLNGQWHIRDRVGMKVLNAVFREQLLN